MSTTFGVKIPSTGEVEPIAKRANSRENIIWFTNPLAELLPDDLKVISMDNTNQGINTVKDIKDLISTIEK